MENRLLVLKLVLDGIGESTNIGSLDDRLRIQKAVYLAQVAGINLGYSYSWYVRGPYSTSLTQDYFELSSGAGAGVTLDAASLTKLADIKSKIQKPDNVSLRTPQWYELLASLHYLIKELKNSLDDAQRTITSSKPHLVSFFDLGLKHLQDKELLA